MNPTPSTQSRGSNCQPSGLGRVSVCGLGPHLWDLAVAAGADSHTEPSPAPTPTHILVQEQSSVHAQSSAWGAALAGPGDREAGAAVRGSPPHPHLQRVKVRQPDTVSPAQVPPEVVVANVDGFQVPGLVPEEVQHVDALQDTEGCVQPGGTGGAGPSANRPRGCGRGPAVTEPPW